jgi:anthranilate/para-aminobenzoate synthase component I
MKNIAVKIIRFIEPSRRCVWCGENAVVDIGGEDYCMACSTIQ